MVDRINANISHASYYSSGRFATAEEFRQRVLQSFPKALFYDVNAQMEHPYLKDMQTAEKFLHGGGQTYRVCRFLLTHFCPDPEKTGLFGFCAMLAYFAETNIVSLSFHYAVRAVTADQIIALRQSGEHRKYSFADGERSCAELAQEICRALDLPARAIEHSYLCEITKFGDYTLIDRIEKEQALMLYGFLSGDEGYSFVPESLARERLSYSWGSRNFIRIYAAEHAFLFLNLLDSPAHESYLARQDAFGTAVYGGCNAYFTMGECPLTVNHGILFSVEFAMMLKALVNDVIAFQSEYNRKKRTSYYRRIRTTRDFRRKIILVLEKVENIEIAEIGEMSAMLLQSQHIAPIVDHVKYLLELLEGDLSLIYSERNNVLVTALTILGLLLAAWQIYLAF